MDGVRALVAALTLGAALVLAGCSDASPGGASVVTAPSATPRAAASTALHQTQTYLPGVEADLYLPTAIPTATPTATPTAILGPGTVVVLVPGGGWTSADRSGLAPLAESLAAAGIVVVNATYRVAPVATFPVPVADIVCAADFAADRAAQAGIPASKVVLLGHSAGAQLAALAALAPEHFRSGCPWPARDVDGLVGLAGPYDVAEVADAAQSLFQSTPGQQPERWREGTPRTWAGHRSPAPAVLLAHGAADSVVPVGQSRDFAADLTAAGAPVELVVVPGAHHDTIYRPEVISAVCLRWLASWPS